MQRFDGVTLASLSNSEERDQRLLDKEKFLFSALDIHFTTVQMRDIQVYKINCFGHEHLVAQIVGTQAQDIHWDRQNDFEVSVSRDMEIGGNVLNKERLVIVVSVNVQGVGNLTGESQMTLVMEK